MTQTTEQHDGTRPVSGAEAPAPSGGAADSFGINSAHYVRPARLERPMTAALRAGILTVGVAGVTGLSVLTGHTLGYGLRASVMFALPLGFGVGFLFAMLLILLPARRFAVQLSEFAARVQRVGSSDREGGFDDLLYLEDDHDLAPIARSVHAALSTAHADRLEAARLRREIEHRVSAQTRLNTAQLTKLSTTDELTGLLNRRGFESMIATMFNDCAAGGPELAVVAIDLDHFKRLNDTCGHDKGDLALKAAGELMKAGTREGDAAARVGGDELFLLLRGVKGDKSVSIAGRLADLFSRHPSAKGLPWPTMSMGIALARGHRARSPEHLLQLADAALYAGKQAGRARCVVYDPTQNPHALNPRAQAA